MPLTNIQILRSAVPYKRPDVTFLLDGQLALNYKAEEPGLFTKLQNGDLIKIGPTSITTNGDFPNQNPDPTGVAGNSVAEKWFDDRAIFHSGVEKIWDGVNWRTVSGFTLDDATGDMEMLRTLGVDTLNANQVNINGGLDVAGNITPAGTSCVHDIGLAGERWNNFFGCQLDIQFDAQVGNDLQILNDVTIGNDVAITGNIFVTGQSATFGQNCLSGNFTVETPAFLNCDTTILGDVVVGAGITTVGDLDIGGNTRIGGGCGVSTFVVDADTTFNCPVTFSGSTFIFGTGCATSNIVWNGSMTQNCDLIPDPTSTVNLGSATNTYDTVSSDNFQGGAFDGSSLVLSAKGISAATVDGDAPLTLTTKGWVEATVQNAVTAADEWERVNGNEIRSNVAGNHIVKNGTGSLGTATNRWDDVFADNHIGQTLTLGGKGTSASTVAADPVNTLTTKDYVDTEVANAIASIDIWDVNGDDYSPNTAGVDLVKNTTGDIGDAASPWDNVYGSAFVGGTYTGSTLGLTGKATAATTLTTDGATTLTTKDYVDAQVIAANFLQRAGDDISPVNAGDDFLMNGTGDIGAPTTPWDNIYGANIAGGTLSGSSLAMTGKGTSAATVAADPVTTLTTKGYVDTLIAGASPWTRLGTQIFQTTANDDVVPNGATSNFGATGNRWANGYFNNVFTNDLHLKNERGDWTMIEEEDVLTLRNNKTGKRYAISMTPYVG